MMWGTEVSNKWLTSILVSFTQDVLFIQPIKVIIVASLLAFIIKKAPEDESIPEYQKSVLYSKVKVSQLQALGLRICPEQKGNILFSYASKFELAGQLNYASRRTCCIILAKLVEIVFSILLHSYSLASKK